MIFNPHGKRPADKIQPAMRFKSPQEYHEFMTNLETLGVTGAPPNPKRQIPSRLKELAIWLIVLILFIVGIAFANRLDLAPCHYDTHGNCN